MSCLSFSPNKSVFTNESVKYPVKSAANLETNPYVRIQSKGVNEYRIKISSIDSNWKEYPGTVKIRFGSNIRVIIDEITLLQEKWEQDIPDRIWISVSNGQIRLGFGNQIITTSQVFVLNAPVDWEHPDVFPYLSRISVSKGIVNQVDFCKMQNSKSPLEESTESIPDSNAKWIFPILFILMVIIIVINR